MIKVFILVAIFTALSGCALAQPYASLYQTPNPQPTLEGATTLAGSPTARATCKVEVTQALNLRACPGVDCQIIGALYPGDVLINTGNQRDTWQEVITAGGVIGWVNSNYCNNNKGK